MPQIENLERKPFTKTHESSLLNVHRKEVLYREDLKTGFGYAIAGLTISLAIAGGVYVIGKQLLK
jgi:hypothetical protein